MDTEKVKSRWTRSFFTALNTRGDEERYICDICHKDFASPSNLTLHRSTHVIERRYKCEPCQVSFHSQGHLQKHKRSSAHETRVEMTQAFGIPTSDNPRPYGCPECDTAFRKHGHLAKHLRSKSHITKLEANGLIPSGTYAALEKRGQELKDKLVTTNCEQSLHSLRKIAMQLFQHQPDIISSIPSPEQHLVVSPTNCTSYCLMNGSPATPSSAGLSMDLSNSCLKDDSSQLMMPIMSPHRQFQPQQLDGGYQLPMGAQMGYHPPTTTTTPLCNMVDGRKLSPPTHLDNNLLQPPQQQQNIHQQVHAIPPARPPVTHQQLHQSDIDFVSSHPQQAPMNGCASNYVPTTATTMVRQGIIHNSHMPTGSVAGNQISMSSPSPQPPSQQTTLSSSTILRTNQQRPPSIQSPAQPLDISQQQAATNGVPTFLQVHPQELNQQATVAQQPPPPSHQYHQSYLQRQAPLPQPPPVARQLFAASPISAANSPPISHHSNSQYQQTIMAPIPFGMTLPAQQRCISDQSDYIKFE